MSIESDLRELAQRQSNLTSRRARAQMELENATAKFHEARTVLKDEFNLNSGDEIKAEIERLEAERDRLMAEIAEDLSKAGA